MFKYQFPLDDQFALDMPVGAKILHVGVQMERPCIWALIDDAAPSVSRGFSLRGTGHPANGVGKHIATFGMAGGTLVFHLFE